MSCFRFSRLAHGGSIRARGNVGNKMPMFLLNIGIDLEFVDGVNLSCGMRRFFEGVRIFGHNSTGIVWVNRPIGDVRIVFLVAGGLDSLGWSKAKTCTCT